MQCLGTLGDLYLRCGCFVAYFGLHGGICFSFDCRLFGMSVLLILGMQSWVVCERFELGIMEDDTEHVCDGKAYS